MDIWHLQYSVSRIHICSTIQHIWAVHPSPAWSISFPMLLLFLIFYVHTIRVSVYKMHFSKLVAQIMIVSLVYSHTDPRNFLSNFLPYTHTCTHPQRIHTPHWNAVKGEGNPVISASTGWQYESECVCACVCCCCEWPRVRESAWEFLVSPFRGVASCTVPLTGASWGDRACFCLLSPRRLFAL